MRIKKIINNCCAPYTHTSTRKWWWTTFQLAVAFLCASYDNIRGNLPEEESIQETLPSQILCKIKKLAAQLVADQELNFRYLQVFSVFSRYRATSGERNFIEQMKAPILLEAVLTIEIM